MEPKPWVRRRGRCGDLLGALGEEGGVRNRAGGPPPGCSIPVPSPLFLPRPNSVQVTPMSPPGPGPTPCPLSTSGLRNLRGLGEPPRPMSLPVSSGARLPGSRPASRRASRARRTQAPEPAVHSPTSQRSAMPACAARPHNGSGRSLTYPDWASAGPALGSPQDPTCPQDPFPGAPRIAGGLGGEEKGRVHGPKFPQSLKHTPPPCF